MDEPLRERSVCVSAMAARPAPEILAMQTPNSDDEEGTTALPDDGFLEDADEDDMLQSIDLLDAAMQGDVAMVGAMLLELGPQALEAEDEDGFTALLLVRCGAGSL